MSDKVNAVLLGNGGYLGMGNVKFPVSVSATMIGSSGIMVSALELVRVGASRDEFSLSDDYCFVIGKDCEVEE